MSFSKSVVKLRIPIVIVTLLLVALSVFGTVNTRINYDMLDYLPEDMDTVIGQNELAQFGMTKEQYEAGIAAGAITEEQQAKINAAVEAAASGAASIVSLKMQLDSYNTFYTGLKTYTAGVATASSGASKLSAGASELYNGVCKLTEGIFTMQKSAPALVDGVKQLKDGAMRLSDGLNEFNEKGVEKILGAAGDNPDGFALRYKAIIEVSENYKSFAGISDDMDGQVKLVYRTDAIE